MFTLTLVTPNKKLLTDIEIDEVIVPAHQGQLDILPGHAPLVSTLKPGTLKIREKGQTKMRSAVICWGYIEVNPAGVVVLADSAEWPEEIDKEQVRKDLAEAQARLQEAGLSIDDKITAQRKLDREKARLDIFDHLH